MLFSFYANLCVIQMQEQLNLSANRGTMTFAMVDHKQQLHSSLKKDNSNVLKEIFKGAAFTLKSISLIFQQSTIAICGCFH